MPSVYIETTIPSYLAARRSRDLVTAAHQQITHDWWATARDRFDIRNRSRGFSKLTFGVLGLIG